MRSRSTAVASGQALEPARGGAEVALDVGQPVDAGGGDEARGGRGGASWARTSARAGCSGTAVSGSSRRLDLARGVEDADHRDDDPRGRLGEDAGDVAAQPREARLVPRRAAARGDQRVGRGHDGVVEHGGEAAVRRRPTARAGRRWRAGRGRTSRARASRAAAAGGVPAHIAAPLRRRASPAPSRRPSSPRRPAPGRRAPPGRCRAASPRAGASRSSHEVRPVRSSFDDGGGQLGPQQRPHLRAHVARASCRRPARRASRRLDPERHPQVRRQPARSPRRRAGWRPCRSRG